MITIFVENSPNHCGGGNVTDFLYCFSSTQPLTRILVSQTVLVINALMHCLLFDEWWLKSDAPSQFNYYWKGISNKLYLQRKPSERQERFKFKLRLFDTRFIA